MFRFARTSALRDLLFFDLVEALERCFFAVLERLLFSERVLFECELGRAKAPVAATQHAIPTRTADRSAFIPAKFDAIVGGPVQFNVSSCWIS